MNTATLPRPAPRGAAVAANTAPATARPRPALRPLGRTGIQVSEIGFGAWGLGGNSYGPVDDAVSIATLHTAFEQGVNFYDTSDVYGDGHSETVLGQALQPVRSRIVIATKVGLLPHTSFVMPCDFSDEHILRSLDASLKRLRCDYIDVYQLHSPTLEHLARPGLFALLERLKREGRVRAIGVSARSPADGMAALDRYGFDTLQVNFNLIDQRAVECGLFDRVQRQGVGLIARTPLCFGYLTGQLKGTERFGSLDHRANWPAAQLKRWAQAPDLFSFVNDGQPRTPAQLALRFCLDHPAVATTIPGMMKPSEVHENLAASALAPLTAAEHGRIRDVYQTHSFYDPGAKAQGIDRGQLPPVADAAPAQPGAASVSDPAAVASAASPAPASAPADARRQITLADWCAMFDLQPQQFTRRTRERIAALRTGHRPLTPAEVEAHVVRILQRLNAPGAVRNTAENAQAFEAGWDENLRRCREQGVSRQTLQPGYVKPHDCIRWQGAYVAPDDPYLANELLQVAVGHVAERWLAGVDQVHEFGCGTGRFLYELSELFPGKPLVGLDWTQASQGLLALIAASGRPVSGARFDMLAPDAGHRLGTNTGVLTVGAMEQLGDRFGPFLDYLLAQAPAVCVHLEPINDFYRDDTLCDAMANLYHRQRRYLSGYLSALRALEQQGRLRILDARRLPFGCPHHESAACIVWQPLQAS